MELVTGMTLMLFEDHRQGFHARCPAPVKHHRSPQELFMLIEVFKLELGWRIGACQIVAEAFRLVEFLDDIVEHGTKTIGLVVAAHLVGLFAVFVVENQRWSEIGVFANRQLALG